MSQPCLTTYPLEETIAYARANVPFYQRLYAGLPDWLELPQVPVIDQETYWAAHHQDRANVLAAPLHDGIVIRSGGTTGKPKFSYFDDLEWDSTLNLSARAYAATGLRDGDLVANFFAAGNLYASFIFATESLKWCPAKVLQLPIGLSPMIEPAVAIVHVFKPNVLVGPPSHLLRIINQADQDKIEGWHLDRIVHGGEIFTPDRARFLEKRFPGIQIRSAGYASVDAGLIGYADADCAMGEHRLFDGATLIEILDETTGEPIEEPGRPGKIVYTSLIRRLMPLVRYPAGDRAEWVEPPGSRDRKFLLLGRSEESARVAAYSVTVSETMGLLAPFREALGIQEFQLLATRENLLDRLTFRVVATALPPALEAATPEILAAFARQRPDVHDQARHGAMHPAQVEWIHAGELMASERTGKQLRVVDRRNG